jgi:hypothetical protein
MRRLIKASAGLGAVGAVALSIGLIAPVAANADYAPSGSDVVGIGSDTIQYAADFLFDGDALADAGFNSAGSVNKAVNIDATADANARLAYGNGGASGVGSPAKCTPGTGGGNGTAVSGAGTTPCVLNPTVVLRAGTNPVQRPNGSGAGLNAMLLDTTKPYTINYFRSSSIITAGNITSAVTAFGGAGFDGVTLGTDLLGMLAENTTNAVPLSVGQLNGIYTCTGGSGAGGQWTWADAGSTGANKNNLIVPIVPQAGSGTRKTFLADISVTTPGSCVLVGEENDPFAIDNSTSPADAIEPMSGGRLNLYQGILGTGGSNGFGGYFHDPSCPFGITSGGDCATPVLSPTVKFLTGTPSTGTLYQDNRNLYIYFRDSDLASTTPFEPGGSLNWLRTLFANPCTGAGHTTGCTTVGGITYGPGGPPYIAQSPGQALISAAGINPEYIFTVGGPHS